MKKLIKKIKTVVACMIFFALFAGCGKFFHYILVDDTTSFTRLTFHEMYEQDNIDVLFVGSSHCYRAFNPEVFDKELGMNTFNVGTSSQELDGSYMIIQEAAKYNDIKHIYLDLYYRMGVRGRRKDREYLTMTYIISDYLKPSLTKTRYILDASSNEHYINSFILARRNWQKFFDADYVHNLIQKKQSEDYKNYTSVYADAVWETEWYAGKGYVENSETVENWQFFSEEGWNSINLEEYSEDWKEELKDIISFCDKNSISLTLLSVPMPNFTTSAVGNYDEYVEMVENLIADTGVGVDYYDFNLCREEYFPNTSSLFKDVDHLNCYGGEAFSYLLAEFINGEITEDELFYDSFEEKMRNLEPTVFGISYFDDQRENGETSRKCKIVSNDNDHLEYEIILKPKDGDPYVVQEFSNNRFFELNPDDRGVCEITYRLRNLQDQVRTTELFY